MRVEIPVVKQGKSVKVYNEGVYSDKLFELKSLLNDIKPKGADKDFVINSVSNLLKATNEDYHSSNGFVFNGDGFDIVFVKVDKIPQYYTFENIAKTLK